MMVYESVLSLRDKHRNEVHVYTRSGGSCYIPLSASSHVPGIIMRITHAYRVVCKSMVLPELTGRSRSPRSIYAQYIHTIMIIITLQVIGFKSHYFPRWSQIGYCISKLFRVRFGYVTQVMYRYRLLGTGYTNLIRIFCQA